MIANLSDGNAENKAPPVNEAPCRRRGQRFRQGLFASPKIHRSQPKQYRKPEQSRGRCRDGLEVLPMPHNLDGPMVPDRFHLRGKLFQDGALVW
jgi:hypothetical protein